MYLCYKYNGDIMQYSQNLWSLKHTYFSIDYIKSYEQNLRYFIYKYFYSVAVNVLVYGFVGLYNVRV